MTDTTEYLHSFPPGTVQAGKPVVVDVPGPFKVVTYPFVVLPPSPLRGVWDMRRIEKGQYRRNRKAWRRYQHQKRKQ